MQEIIIVDDHPLVLAALEDILSRAFPDTNIQCISSASELKARMYEKKSAEGKRQTLIAFVDLNLPDADGMNVIQELHTKFDIPVIAMSGYADPEKIRACAQRGAAGFIEKTSNLGIYAAVANLVLSGGRFFPLQHIKKEASETSAEGQGFSLTSRQKEVLGLLVDGKPNKIIASTLGLSEGTVKNHVGVLLDRFKVKSRSQLILATMKSNPGPYFE